MLITAEIGKNRVTKVKIAKQALLVLTSHNDLYDLEVYDYTSGTRKTITVCNDEKNFGTINDYAGNFGVRFVEKQNKKENIKANFKIYHDSSAPDFLRYSIQYIDNNGVYSGDGYFAQDLKTVLEWAKDNYLNYRRIFEIIEVNDD